MDFDDDLLTEIESTLDESRSDSITGLLPRLFRRQFDLNEPYRRFCVANGVTPDTLGSWQDIPAAPAAAFRMFDLTCSSIEDVVCVFHSSGTTSGRSSKHHMDASALSLYERSLRLGYHAALKAAGFDPTLEIWALMPNRDQAPHSSLSHMLAALGCHTWFWNDWGQFANAMTERRLSRSKPLAIFGAAIALASAMDRRGGDAWLLPAGSVVIETGGFKGSTRVVEREDFYSRLASTFGLPDSSCLSEYGMCELASQYYSQGVGGALKSPPWLRFRLIDPLTGGDVAPGEQGLLRHYDLANWNSVAVVQTQDVAVANGEGGFRLLGRSPNAEVRGCSLMVS